MRLVGEASQIGVAGDFYFRLLRRIEQPLDGAIHDVENAVGRDHTSLFQTPVPIRTAQQGFRTCFA